MAGEVEMLHLDYDEELEMARLFCEMLDRLNIEDFKSVYDPLFDLFVKKSLGNDFTSEELIGLSDAILKYNECWEPEYSEKYGLPDLGSIVENNNSCIDFGAIPTHSKSKKLTSDERKDLYRKEIARAWKEAWDERPNGYLRERFPRFPGIDLLRPPHTSNDTWDADVKKERKFWAEVDKVQREEKCSRKQAYLYVRDYMPRATFDENQLVDRHKDLVGSPVVDLDTLRDEDQVS